MPAQLEEVVVHADPVRIENLTPDGREQSLGRRARRDRLRAALACAVRMRQGRAVDLAVLRERHRGEDHDRVRQHVAGQPLGERLPKIRRVGRAGSHHRVADKARLPGRVLAQQHHGLANAGQALERGLDLAELDAVSPQLDLVVHASLELQRAVGEQPRQVACPVQPRARRGRERVRHEALRGLLGAVAVAARERDAADVQLAGHAKADALPPRVEQQDLAVEHRGAHRDDPGRVVPRERASGDRDRRLARAVGVDRIRAGGRREELPRELERHGLAADQDPVQARRISCLRVGEKRREHRRDEVRRRDPGALNRAAQVRGVAVAAGLRHDDPGPDRERPEQLPHRHVEPGRGLEEHPVVAVQRPLLLHPAHLVHDGPVRRQRPLRTPRRTGRVDHVGDVVLGHPGQRWRVGREPDHRLVGVNAESSDRRPRGARRRWPLRSAGCVRASRAAWMRRARAEGRGRWRDSPRRT